jgi:glycosyltransferase involved in cell wall biosynthesis
MKVSVIIPSRTEKFLPETVRDCLVKARGDVEVIPVLEDYQPEQEEAVMKAADNDTRVKPIRRDVGQHKGMRQSINEGVHFADGDFIMKLDAHCMMSEGYDVELAKVCEARDIIIPRRYSLDPEEWKIRSGRPAIDYEFISFPYGDPFRTVRHGNKWYERAEERKDIAFDENMAFQGSCYFMRRDNFLWLGGLQTFGYESIILESEELGNKNWLTGGRTMTYKPVWYAHLHKGKQYGRMYFINKWEMRRGRKYHIDLWMHDKWERADRPFSWLVSHFWPVPTWPDDWQTNPEYERRYLEAIGESPSRPQV